MNEVATVVLDEFILPAPVAQIEESVASGEQVCAGCQQPLQLHKRGVSTHVKTIFGSSIELCRHQYYCPGCESYEMVSDSILGFVGQRMTPRLRFLVYLRAISSSFARALSCAW